MFTVTSEIYQEKSVQPIKLDDGKVISKFKFKYPNEREDNNAKCTVDEDGDLEVKRKRNDFCEDGVIEVEHSIATQIDLVGLQVWRGALLLADFCFHKRFELRDKQILELGAGVGLTSIAAAIYARKVFCTDVNIGGILDLIKHNVQRNAGILNNAANKVDVLEYDFKKCLQNHCGQLLDAIDESDIVVAADVIYDDDLTDAFIGVIDEIFVREQISGRPKRIFVALEKRYVFTVSELDAVAPMFEYFVKQTLSKSWRFDYINIDFPQYFEYERSKHLVLLQLTRR